jgi:hypothetical protein
MIFIYNNWVRSRSNSANRSTSAFLRIAKSFNSVRLVNLLIPLVEDDSSSDDALDDR